jgi:hypothetical protein
MTLPPALRLVDHAARGGFDRARPWRPARELGLGAVLELLLDALASDMERFLRKWVDGSNEDSFPGAGSRPE